MSPPDPAPRPGRPKSPAKRDAIIAAAQHRFTQESFDRVSLDLIAADAGVSKVTIYSHFPNKEALFIAAVSAGCEAVFARVDLNAPDTGPIEDVLYQLGCDFLGMIFDPDVDRLHAVILSEGPHRPELPQMFYDSVVRRSTELFAAYLKVQAACGVIAIDDSYNAAVQFLAMVQGEFRYRVELGLPAARREEIEPYVRGCVATLLRAWRVA
jgi:TetR/AcrR family transcriptional regulator, mexJK operon transcriptional repressor